MFVNCVLLFAPPAPPPHLSLSFPHLTAPHHHPPSSPAHLCSLTATNCHHKDVFAVTTGEQTVDRQCAAWLLWPLEASALVSGVQRTLTGRKPPSASVANKDRVRILPG